ncbi:MAG: hypothetical protein WD557_03340 [Dehalococcoidia bacterium]
MSGVRYWVVVVLVLVGVGALGAVAARELGWPPVLVGAATALAAGAGIIAGIVPPGRLRFRPAPFERRETEPLWPYISGPERAQFTRYAMEAAVADERRGATWVGLTMAALIVGLGMGAAGTVLFAAARSEDLLSAQIDRLAGFADPTGEPVVGIGPETPTPDTPPSTPTPEPATPRSTATEVPTRTPTPERSTTPGRSQRRPDPTSTATPTATPRPSQEQPTVSMSGRWRVTDTVHFGMSTGQSFTVDISLSQQGQRVTGTGSDGFRFEGHIDGNVLTLAFTSPGGVGIFIWGLLPDGSFTGDWRDYTAQNGGPSTMSRVH